MPISVLISETASAPAFSTAFAITVISVTLGESFTITGTVDFSLTAVVTAAAISGTVPNATPPFFTLGHDILTSTAAIPFTSARRSAISRYSCSVSPRIFTTTGTSIACRDSIFSVINRLTPTFSSPMAFSIPHDVSTIRGGGFPARASREMPFTTTAPRRLRFT